ncbi:MAG: 30S ribosomal protein S21 [Rickettsiales bacterium]|jgi:small subunit ribosomal protein S21|nr:30S ribosomal protein S21 [Rickettsiales bacterium]
MTLRVLVGDQNKLDMALRVLRKKVRREGILKEAKVRAEFEKPSEKRKRKRKESVSRMKKKRR